jgi:hypothetical protein
MNTVSIRSLISQQKSSIELAEPGRDRTLTLLFVGYCGTKASIRRTLTADSLRQAQGGLSPGWCPVRNDKTKSEDYPGNNLAGLAIWVKIEAMPFILEHLTSLRQEITDLRNMNAQSSSRSADSQIDQSAVEMRANRLAEIKRELSQMLNRPEDPRVWWEKGGRGNRVA